VKLIVFDPFRRKDRRPWVHDGARWRRVGTVTVEPALPASALDWKTVRMPSPFMLTVTVGDLQMCDLISGLTAHVRATGTAWEIDGLHPERWVW